MGMLCLSRKLNEVIVIGEDENLITIKVIDIDGDRVRLGITARRDVRVDRGEVRERMEKGAKR